MRAAMSLPDSRRLFLVFSGELFAVKEVSLGPDVARNSEAVQQLQQEVRRGSEHTRRPSRSSPLVSNVAI